MSRVFPSDADFLLLQTTDPKLLTKLMEEHGIKIRDRSGVVDEAVRISIGTVDENDQMLKVSDHYGDRVAPPAKL